MELSILVEHPDHAIKILLPLEVKLPSDLTLPGLISFLTGLKNPELSERKLSRRFNGDNPQWLGVHLTPNGARGINACATRMHHSIFRPHTASNLAELLHLTGEMVLKNLGMGDTLLTAMRGMLRSYLQAEMGYPDDKINQFPLFQE